MSKKQTCEIGSETVHRQDSSLTYFGDRSPNKIGNSSPTYLKTVHRQNNIWEYQK